MPTNVAFALPGNQQIAVTEYEHGQLEIYNTRRMGCHFGLDQAHTERRLNVFRAAAALPPPLLHPRMASA